MFRLSQHTFAPPFAPAGAETGAPVTLRPLSKSDQRCLFATKPFSNGLLLLIPPMAGFVLEQLIGGQGTPRPRGVKMQGN